MSAAPINRSIPVPPTDLETRVANRKRELIAEIVEHKKNISRIGAAAAIGVVDGWANVGPSAKLELDEWIAK